MESEAPQPDVTATAKRPTKATSGYGRLRNRHHAVLIELERTTADLESTTAELEQVKEGYGRVMRLYEGLQADVQAVLIENTKLVDTIEELKRVGYRPAPPSDALPKLFGGAGR